MRDIFFSWWRIQDIPNLCSNEVLIQRHQQKAYYSRKYTKTMEEKYMKILFEYNPPPPLTLTLQKKFIFPKP